LFLSQFLGVWWWWWLPGLRLRLLGWEVEGG
jgi:hypothetical protein